MAVAAAARGGRRGRRRRRRGDGLRLPPLATPPPLAPTSRGRWRGVGGPSWLLRRRCPERLCEFCPCGDPGRPWRWTRRPPRQGKKTAGGHGRGGRSVVALNVSVRPSPTAGGRCSCAPSGGGRVARRRRHVHHVRGEGGGAVRVPRWRRWHRGRRRRDRSRWTVPQREGGEGRPPPAGADPSAVGPADVVGGGGAAAPLGAIVVDGVFWKSCQLADTSPDAAAVAAEGVGGGGLPCRPRFGRDASGCCPRVGRSGTVWTAAGGSDTA